MTTLIDIRDEINVVKNFVACLFMACQFPPFPTNERHALCAVCDAAREKLEAVVKAMDDLIAAERQGPSDEA